MQLDAVKKDLKRLLDYLKCKRLCSCLPCRDVLEPVPPLDRHGDTTRTWYILSDFECTYEDYTGKEKPLTTCGRPDRETIVSFYVFRVLVLRRHPCVPFVSFSLEQSKKLRRMVERASSTVCYWEEGFGALANGTAIDGGHCHYMGPGTSSTHPGVHHLEQHY